MPSDPFWAKQDAKRESATFVGDEVYYVIRHGDGDEEIGKAMNWASSAWPGSLGVLTVAAQDDPVLSTRQIDPVRWPSLATETASLLVGAYDGEGYLIWRRHA